MNFLRSLSSRPGLLTVCGSLLFAGSGCSSFAAVRSAEVDPGLSLDVRATASTSPGDEAGWFWSFDCAQNCGRPILSGEAALTYGWLRAELDGGDAVDPEPRRLGAEAGIGINGLLNPFIEGYMQLRGGDRPLGVGARIGVPFPSPWSSSAVYMRMDRPHDDGRAILFNPTLFLHYGNSPNAANPGLFVGVSPAVGYLVRGPRMSFVTSIAPMLGYTSRQSYSTRTEGAGAFITAGFTVRFHRPQDP